MADAIEFDFYGRKRKPVAGINYSEEPYVTQTRLRGSLLRMGRRSGPLHIPVQTQNTEEFWRHYSNGSLNIRLFLKDMGRDLVKLEIDSQFVASSTTECITLHRNNLGDEGFAVLAEKFLRSTNLLHLQVSSNKLTDRTLINYEPLFATNKSILSLVLCENDFTKDGFQAIANFLKGNTSLRVLDLTKTQLDLEGFTCLVEGVKENTTLLYLGVRDNDLEDDSTEVVCDLISSNKTLMFLDLSENVFDINSAQRMLETLKTDNFSLVDIDLSDTDIDTEDSEEVKVLEELNKVFLRNIDAPKKALKEALTFAQAPWRRTKLMVVGQGRAGKTATIRSLLGMEFNPNWDSTIGAEIIQTKTRTAQGIRPWQVMEKADIDEHNKEFLKEVLISEAGNILNELKMKDKNAPKQEKPKHNTSGENDKVGDFIPKLEEVTKVKINDIIDNIEDEVTIEATSSQKNQLVMSIWDYGGQQVFYTLHHLFLTKFGIYLIVFDLVEFSKNQKESEEYLKYWLNSCKLHSNSSPVFLVGTHLNELKTHENTVLKKVATSLAKIHENKPTLFDNVVQNQDNGYVHYVDNRNLRGVMTLRSKIFETALKQDHLNIKVPIFWLNILDEIFNIDHSFISLDEVVDLVIKQTGIKANEDKEAEKKEANSILNMTKRMLKYFHELGILLYYTSNSVLENLVILKPQWILDVLSTIIKDKKIHLKLSNSAVNSNQVSKKDIEQAGLTKEYKRLYDTGIVSQDLLEYLLKSSKSIVNHYRQTTKKTNVAVDLNEFFISLMKKTLLMSIYPDSADVKENYFLIPSLLGKSSSMDKRVVSKFLKGKNVFKFEYDFHTTFLPIGLYERIICLLLEYIANMKDISLSLLKSDQSLLKINSNETLLFQVSEDKITVFVKVNDMSQPMKAYNIVNIIVERVKADIMGANLKFFINFYEKNAKLTMEEARKVKLAPFFIETKAKKDDHSDLDIEAFLEDF